MSFLTNFACILFGSEGSHCRAAERRAANWAANNGRERKDLYTDKWDGAEYKGSPVNILTVILAISVLVPLAGIIFATQTYGTLWG